jgi:serine/threonine-protein kinase
LRSRFTAAALVGLTTVLTASGGYLWGRRAAPPSAAPALIHATIDIRPARRLTESWRTDLTWTADGRSLIFAAEEGNRGEERLSRSARLYVRRLDETVAHPLPYTVGGNAPFVSPDGQWVGFWVEAERAGLWEMRKVALGDDRPPVTICQVPNTFPPMGASWGDDGTIVFAFTTGGLWAVPDRGGTPRRLTELERGEVSHRLPHVLPGSRAVLFTIRHTVSTWGHEQIGLLEFVTGKRMVVEEAGTDARYAPTGHLVFLRLGTLLAAPFDLQRLRVSAGAVPLFGQVSQAASIDHYSDDSLAGEFAISRNGDLALVRSSGSIGVTPNEMLWVDRDGRQTPLPGISWPGAPIGSRMSPDGARAVVLIREPTRFDLWILDLARGTLGRLTTGDEVDAPVWSPDGREIVFARPAMRQIVRRSVDRGDREVVVFEAPEHDAGVLYPSSWGPGNVLAVSRDSPTRGFDIGTIDMDSPAPAFRELLAAPVEECWPVFSPDGKWLAYVSSETERLEVYVRPYPSMEPKIHVSKQRGMGPVWGATGRELFFAGGVNGNISLTALSIDTTGGRVRLGSETRLFAASHDSGGLYVGFPSVYYSVTRDGRRFLIHKLPLAATPPQVTGIDVVLNWSVELKAKVPTRK